MELEFLTALETASLRTPKGRPFYDGCMESGSTYTVP